jgi:hypothetical protein
VASFGNTTSFQAAGIIHIYKIPGGVAIMELQNSFVHDCSTMHPLHVSKRIHSTASIRVHDRQISEGSLDSFESVPEQAGWELSLRIPKKRSLRGGQLQALYDGMHGDGFLAKTPFRPHENMPLLATSTLNMDVFNPLAGSHLQLWGTPNQSSRSEGINDLRSSPVMEMYRARGPPLDGDDQRTLPDYTFPNCSRVDSEDFVEGGLRSGLLHDTRALRPQIRVTPEVSFIDASKSRIWVAIEVSAVFAESNDSIVNLGFAIPNANAMRRASLASTFPIEQVPHLNNRLTKQPDFGMSRLG